MRDSILDKLTIGELAELCEGDLFAGDPADRAHGVSIDSRTIEKDFAFVAIKGERFDGHDFVQAAIEGEVRRLTQQLTGRVKELEERYSQTLPELKQVVDGFTTKVEGHLKKMGLVWS